MMTEFVFLKVKVWHEEHFCTYRTFGADLILDTGCMSPDCMFIQYQESSIQNRLVGATNRTICKSLGKKGNSYTIKLVVPRYFMWVG